MAENRFRAIELATNRPDVDFADNKNNIPEYFGENVFTMNKIQKQVPPSLFKQLEQCIAKGERINLEMADAVASAMKSWAISKGVTHFTHWFQPLTHATAEKHDVLYDFSNGDVIEKFKGSALIQQEPDASSFPSGGLRNTFEARGYTAWDPSSPAFIFDLAGGKVLCIPTIFVSYTGEALDHKFPLLKALDAVNKAATAVCQYFDKNVTHVTTTLGPEQEYFVVDRSLYYGRPDLYMSGRTLFGHSPAKHQQLADHYFGSIPARVRRFMKDFEVEALRLGIPITTRHNEVAPAQFECAPLFEEANLACDHNQLLMDVMEMVAERHHLKVIFHEKPFAGINGTGKHNNWSMSTNTGVNLLAPGHKPNENLLFMTFFINTLKALHVHGDIIRAAIASPANDHRLGANEAPPAIISAFIGSTLSEAFDAFESNKPLKEGGKEMYMQLGLDKIPEIPKDNTDRNRTSPFAFTGNKFELRAVGGSATCSLAMMALNSIVAAQLMDFKEEVDALIAKKTDKEVAIATVLKKYAKECRNIIFDGDGYSEEWIKEAEKRGLPHLKTTPDALSAFVSDKSKKLFSKVNVLSARELEARNEVYLEQYCITLEIEAHLYKEMSYSYFVPAAVKYQAKLAENIGKLKSIGMDKAAKSQEKIVATIADYIDTITDTVSKIEKAQEKAESAKNMEKKAEEYCNKVKPLFETIRTAVDQLEHIVDDQEWPMLKYREILFMR